MNPSLEQVVLGGLLLDEKNEYSNVESINSDWFIGLEERELFKKLRKAKLNGLRYDCNSAKNRGIDEHTFGMLSIWACNVSLLPDLINDMKVSYIKLRLTDDLDTDEIIALADQLKEVKKEKIKLFHTHNNMVDYINYIGDIRDGKIQLMTWTFPMMDKDIGRLKPGNMIVFGAETGTGKTNIMVNMAFNMLCLGKKVFYLTAEEIDMEIMNRFVALQTKLSLQKIQDGLLDTDEMAVFMAGCEKIKGMDLRIFQTSSFNISQIEKIVNENEYDIIFIDHIHRMSIPGKSGNRAAEFSEMASQMKNIALANGKPLITGAQIRRDKDFKPGDEPHIHMLKESGGIAENADKVILLWRGAETDNSMIINYKVVKNRQGGLTTRAFNMSKSDCSFREYDVNNKKEE